MRFSNESVDQFYSHGVHLPTRTLYIGDGEEVDSTTASRVVKGLHLLSSINKKSINVILNTTGGCTRSGLAIYDAIHDCDCYVTVRVLGAAMSMGAIIIQAADERIMHANATLMMHDGSLSIDSNSRDVESWGEFCKAQRLLFYSIIAKRTARTTKYWERRFGNDFIVDAKRALAERLIDRIANER